LHLAAISGRLDLIPWLWTPAVLECQNNQGLTPLQQALLAQHWRVAAVIIAYGASPYGLGSNPSLSSWATPFECDWGPGLVLRALLADPGPDGLVARALAWRNTDGATPLHVCASTPGSVQLVANLVRAGADVGALDANGRTPLYLAAAAGQATLLPLLATPTTINRETTSSSNPGTPLSAAAAGGHLDMVVALLAAGGQPDACITPGRNPLNMAVSHGQMQVVPVLLRALASKYLRPQQQGPEQQHQGGQQQGQQQRHQQGWGAPNVPALELYLPEQPPLIKLVTGVVLPAAEELHSTPRCAQLLEIVIHELGPEFAAAVCQHAQRHACVYSAPDGVGHPGDWRPFCEVYGERPSSLPCFLRTYLAEALLLGWLRAEGFRRIPARLQRLVPGVGGGQQPLGQMQGQQQVHAQPQQLVQEAVLAAVYGRQQQAAALLGNAAELYLQQPALDGGSWAGAHSQAQHTPAGVSLPAHGGHHPMPPQARTAASSQGMPPQQMALTAECVPALPQLVHGGLVAAARAHKESNIYYYLAEDTANHPYYIAAGKVLDTFLSGWVAARGGGSKELVGAVVAAVKAARQQSCP
jgi:ankyrin repeat protein